MSLQRDFLPSAWHGYAPTWVDWSLFVGTFALLHVLFLAFLRLVPFIPLSELKEMGHELGDGARAMKRGMLAEFGDPERDAPRHRSSSVSCGYRCARRVHAVPDPRGRRCARLTRSPLNWMVLPFALVGAQRGGFFMQWWCNAYRLSAQRGRAAAFSRRPRGFPSPSRWACWAPRSAASCFS